MVLTALLRSAQKAVRSVAGELPELSGLVAAGAGDVVGADPPVLSVPLPRSVEGDVPESEAVEVGESELELELQFESAQFEMFSEYDVRSPVPLLVFTFSAKFSMDVTWPWMDAGASA
jgi:hypothetical protein